MEFQPTFGNQPNQVFNYSNYPNQGYYHQQQYAHGSQQNPTGMGVVSVPSNQIFLPFQSQPTFYPNPLQPPNYNISQIITPNSSDHVNNNENQTEDELPPNNKHAWQVFKKRKRSHNPIQINDRTSQISTSNRFNALLTEDTSKEPEEQTAQPKIPTPPPVYIHGVENFDEMIKNLSGIIEKEQYYTRSLSDNMVKINTREPNVYRTLVRHLKDENIVHHTYQLKEDRAYRIVIRGLHHGTSADEIKEELKEQGHIIRNIHNIRHRISKEPLPLFFVDIEPKPNNTEIFKLQYLNNQKITIESPRKKNDIVQCTRCQCYGHTKTYCTKPFSCVKCGGGHNSTTCKKTRETPPKCALCDGNHPANYKGCSVYKDLQNARSKNSYKIERNPNIRRIEPVVRINTQVNNAQMINPWNNNSASRNIANSNGQQNNTTDILTNFLGEFKAMFNQLISQNSMIINMLTTVISKSLK